MDNPQSIKECLLGAAKILEEEGWIKRDYFKKNKGYCAVGAITESAFRMVSGEHGFFLKMYRQLDTEVVTLINEVERNLRYCIPEGKIRGVTNWNDFAAKDKKQVISEMKKCAEQL